MILRTATRPPPRPAKGASRPGRLTSGAMNPGPRNASRGVRDCSWGLWRLQQRAACTTGLLNRDVAWMRQPLSRGLWWESLASALSPHGCTCAPFSRQCPGAPMVAVLTASPTRSKVRPQVGTASSRRYKRRRPEKTPLYKIVAEHLEGWLENRAVAEQPVSAHIERELRSYLTCGILCFGIGRAPAAEPRPIGVEIGLRRGALEQGGCNRGRIEACSAPKRSPNTAA